MLASAARWFRVPETQVPRVLLIYDCGECLDFVRGREGKKSIIEVSNRQDGARMYLLWYAGVPTDDMLAQAAARLVNTHFNLHATEPDVLRCAAHVTSEVGALISASELQP